MATFDIPDLRNWKRSAILWGAVGLVSLFVSKTPGILLLLPLALGAAAGTASALCIGRGKWTMAAISYGALAILIGILLSRNAIPNALGYFAMGSLFVAAEKVSFGILGDRAVKKMNHRYRDVLAALTPKPPTIGLPEVPIDQGEATEAFLGLLPGPLQGEFRGSLQDVISLHPFRSLESLAPTQSALGGVPFLATDQEWPSREGTPLDFLAQIDLSQIPPHVFDSAPSGTLAFFYDVENAPWGSEAEDIGAAVIIHTPQGVAGKSVLKPGTRPPAPLRLPVGFVHTRELCLTGEQEDRFYEHFRSLPDPEKSQLEEVHDILLGSSSGYNRILSPPNRIQNDMDSDLAVASAAYGLPEGTAWVMVLQIDSVDELGWQWGDAGCLYFHLPSEDLATGRFDRPWVVLQCH